MYIKAAIIATFPGHPKQEGHSIKLKRRPKMHNYPGLGLPLRHNNQETWLFYPIGAHGSCYGSESDLIPVRELAMMDVMEKLTDKQDWHKRVFDAEVVEKWKKEALAIPDQAWWDLSVSGKHQLFPESSDQFVIRFHDDSIRRQNSSGIMTEQAFNCVSCRTTNQLGITD